MALGEMMMGGLGGGGAGGAMSPQGGGGEMAVIFEMATQILGRPPRDLQEAAQAVFAQHPTDGAGEGLERMGAQPPFLQAGGRPMPGMEHIQSQPAQQPPFLRQQMPQMPFSPAPMMPQQRR